MRTQSKVLGLAAVLLLPALAAAQLPYSKWTYQPDSGRYACEYRYERRDGRPGTQYAVTYTKADPERYGWVYYYNADKKPWARCATVGNSKYDAKVMYWQKLNAAKDGYEEYAEKGGYCPTPADGYAPIPPVPAPPSVAEAPPVVAAPTYTPWTYDPVGVRYVCEYRYPRKGSPSGVQYAVSYTKADKDRYGWIYYYSPDATPWGRCATVDQPKYEEKKAYWQKMKPAKDGYEEYPEKPGFVPPPPDGTEAIVSAPVPPAPPAPPEQPGTVVVAAGPDEGKPNRLVGVHKVVVDTVPQGTKNLQMWFWLPMELPYQKVNALAIKDVTDANKAAVAGAKTWEVKDGNHRYLYVEIPNPPAKFTVEYDFDISRMRLEPKLKGVTKLDKPFPDDYKTEFGNYLKTDATSGIRVTDKLREYREAKIGKLTDKLEIMRAIYTAATTEFSHYNRPSNKKRKTGEPGLIGSTVADDERPFSGKMFDLAAGKLVDHVKNAYMDIADAGDPETCITNFGGGCTDIHSTVVYLARSSGIPARIQFGSRVNASKKWVVDQPYTPGYRCMVEYWLPGYGWIPTDCAQGGNVQENDDGTPKPEAERVAAQELYFSGMDDARLSFVEGRPVVLKKPNGEPVYTAPLFIGAWVLCDGNKHKNYDRTITLTK